MTEPQPEPERPPPVRQDIADTAKMARAARWQRGLIFVGIAIGIAAPFFRSEVAYCLDIISKMLK